MDISGTPQNIAWYFEDTESGLTLGTRFRNGNRPPEETFANLLWTIFDHVGEIETDDGLSISVTPATETSKKIVRLGLDTYVAPTVSLSLTANKTPGTYEVGDNIILSAITLTYNYNSYLKSIISESTITVDGTPFNKIPDIPRPISETITYNVTFTGSNSKDTYIISVSTKHKKETDISIRGTAVNNLTYNMYRPIYYGFVSSAGQGAASIVNKSKIIQKGGSGREIKLGFQGSNGHYMFAYPAYYGDLSQIFDTNLFTWIGAWSKRTVTISCLDGQNVLYNVYETIEATTTPNNGASIFYNTFTW